MSAPVETTGYIETVNKNANSESEIRWTEIIRPESKLLQLKFKELWRYKDLVMMFVKRDFVANYKQTILGPIWIFLQPLLTSLTYMLIFGRFAGFAPHGVPMLAFYLAGVTIWNYFSETLNKTATVFKDNAQMLGKVYFPRLTMPVSIVISNLIRFLIQFALFVLVCVYYIIQKAPVSPNIYILLTPALIIMMGILALGFGMIISALTTRYRDLIYLLTFGIQLLMFATPVIYPLEFASVKYRWLILANPMSSIVETFRYAFLGNGIFNWNYLLYSFIMSLIILFIGTIVFNKVERSFTDTV